MSENIKEKNSVTQYKEDMTRYTIYVSRRRVTPEYRDGLKPVQRKIIFCMYNDTDSIMEFIKSASIVGKVMEKYHPHGDSAIYGTMKPMANWFETNIPLIEPQGNFGSFQGDPAAHYRYTEVRLSKFAIDCIISELRESNQVVDWDITFNNKTKEPEYLPVAIPLLLINGSFGIGVGMKIEIPRHNINDVIDSTLKLIQDPNASIELIPDHSMPCQIFKTDFKSISNKGFGSYKVRGIIDIETYDGDGRTNQGRSLRGNPCLIIKSIPDLTFLNSITEKIEDLVMSKKLIQIEDVFDDSTEHQMRFIIILKKGSDPNFVREVIYKNTEMQKNCRVNFEVLDGIKPMRMSYKSYLLSFIEFRKLTKFRLYCNKLQQVQTRLHERDAYIKVLQSNEITNIINMIRDQTTIDDDYLIEYLVTKLDITDLQAQFILGSNIKKLSLGYLNKYIEDAKKLNQIKDDYLNKIVNDNNIVQEIINELLEYKHKYGKPKKCIIIDSKNEVDIPKGEFKIVVTENNFIKKIPINGSIGSFRGDNPKRVIKVNNTENILIFDEQGKVFKLPVHKIPFTDKNNNGTDIRILIKGLTSNINTIMYEPLVKEFSEKINRQYLVVVTSTGNIKKMDLGDFLTVPISGIMFIKLDPGDVVQDIMIIGEKYDIIIYSDKDALRLNMVDVPHFKRNTKGSRSIITNDKIDGISIIKHDTTDIVVLTESGKINRFDVTGLASLGRPNKGTSVIKLSKNDKIKEIYGLNKLDSIRIITKNDRIEIKVQDLEIGSSIGAGNKIISTKNDNIVRCDIIKGKA